MQKVCAGRPTWNKKHKQSCTSEWKSSRTMPDNFKRQRCISQNTVSVLNTAQQAKKKRGARAPHLKWGPERKFASEWSPRCPEVHQNSRNFNFWEPLEINILPYERILLKSTLIIQTTPVKLVIPSKMINHHASGSLWHWSSNLGLNVLVPLNS